MGKKISVCIPAYNRSAVLPELLDSILEQDYTAYEVLICEDDSRERPQIRAIVERYDALYPGRIRYIENEKNLGYDKNMRTLVANAQGEYCMFMGNDDLMCKGALKKVASTLDRYENVGVIVRSYASFENTPDNIKQIFRYFPEERVFPAGADSISTVFRRSVVIPGMVVHTKAAQRLKTSRFDGTLLYQVFLIANILVEMKAVFLPDILVYWRIGGIPEHGTAEVEQGKFVPADRTPASSLQFMKGMLDVAAGVEKERGVIVYKRIVADISNYSYPILAVQARQPLPVFFAYWLGLAKLGFGRYPLFHCYFLSLVLLGEKRMDRVIASIKRHFGHTPVIGSVFKGESAR